VYVTAFLLGDGEALMPTLSAEGAGSELLVPGALEIDEAAMVARVPADAARRAFYNSCARADADWAVERLSDQALTPSVTPLAMTPERFGSVPRSYVLCKQDRAITPVFQREMAKRGECQQVFEIEADHSPFLSAPEALAETLDTVARARLPAPA
jgi:hypothetical protein